MSRTTMRNMTNIIVLLILLLWALPPSHTVTTPSDNDYPAPTFNEYDGTQGLWSDELMTTTAFGDEKSSDAATSTPRSYIKTTTPELYTSTTTPEYETTTTTPEYETTSKPEQTKPPKKPDFVIPDNCMKCICKQEGCEKNIGKCNPDPKELACGPYQIHEIYYKSCHSPGTGWQDCTKQRDCSEICVKAYMARWIPVRVKDRKPTCRDVSRLHNGGSDAVREQEDPKKEAKLVAYWAEVKKCCDKIPGGCD